MEYINQIYLQIHRRKDCKITWRDCVQMCVQVRNNLPDGSERGGDADNLMDRFMGAIIKYDDPAQKLNSL